MLRPKVGDLVRLKLVKVKRVDANQFWIYNQDGIECVSSFDEIDEVIPRAFEAGDRVTYMVDAIGGWAEIRSGAVIAIHGGRAWIKWDHGSDSLERLVNLQLEDKGEGK